jgi:hypothetical protein
MALELESENRLNNEGLSKSTHSARPIASIHFLSPAAPETLGAINLFTKGGAQHASCDKGGRSLQSLTSRFIVYSEPVRSQA